MPRLGDPSNEIQTIVLLAHGPASATLTAARRLESAIPETESIVVVEGTPAGATAVERAADRGYSTAPDLGSALSGRDGTVLAIHDDVQIEPSDIAAMVGEHRASDLVVVPASSMASSTERAQPIDVVCAVGSAAQIIDLAAQAAFGPGMAVEGEFAPAPGVAVVHHQTCQTRRVKPRDLGRPLLVAALIVRDEEDHLSDCLTSLDGIVDRIEVVDTGSLDRTIEIARRAGANVTEIEWRDDFAWARNAALDRCTDAAVMLWIDADERLCCDDPVEFREMLATYHPIYPSYALELRNVNAGGVETHSFVTRRLADPSLVRFEGAIHEQAERLDGRPLVTAFVTNISITHLGYDESVIDLREKMQRNLEIARKGFEDDPSETNAVQLARALKGASDDPIRTLTEIAPIRASLSGASSTIRSLIHGLEAELLLTAERLDDAIDAARACLELVPADAAAGAVLAEALRRTNHPEAVVESANDYRNRPSDAPLFTDHLAKQTRARIVFEAAIQVDDAATALEYRSDLHAELDPWPPLMSRLPLDQLVDLAPEAAADDDERYVRAVTGNSQLTRNQLERISAAFASTTRQGIRDLLTAADADLSQIDRHEELRAAFDESGSDADAVAYARCLCAGHVDLALELDDVTTSPSPISSALALAAEAHVRRGAQDVALMDALASLDHWAGAWRAIVVAAKAALGRGEPQRALDVIDAGRQAEPAEHLTTSRRHQIATLAARAHLDLRQLRAAVAEAAELVEDGAEFDLWGPLLAAAGTDMDATTLVLGLALLGDGEGFIDALATSIAPQRCGQLCATYLALGGSNPDAVSTGLLAASLSGQHEVALVIVEHASLVPADIRDRLADHLIESSPLIAARLRASLSV